MVTFDFVYKDSLEILDYFNDPIIIKNGTFESSLCIVTSRVRQKIVTFGGFAGQKCVGSWSDLFYDLWLVSQGWNDGEKPAGARSPLLYVKASGSLSIQARILTELLVQQNGVGSSGKNQVQVVLIGKCNIQIGITTQ